MTEPAQVLEFRQRRRKPSSFHQPLRHVLAEWGLKQEES